MRSCDRQCELSIVRYIGGIVKGIINIKLLIIGTARSNNGIEIRASVSQSSVEDDVRSHANQKEFSMSVACRKRSSDICLIVLSLSFIRNTPRNENTRRVYGAIHRVIARYRQMMIQEQAQGRSSDRATRVPRGWSRSPWRVEKRGR